MKYTEKKAAVACNRLLKEARKGKREALYNPWIDKQGRTCLVDGYRAYRLNERPAGILDDIPGCDPIQHVNLDVVFALLDSGKVEEMPAPDYNAVKSFLAEHKESVKPGYDLGTVYPMMNPVYIRDALELFPDGKWFVDVDPYGRMIHPVFVVSEYGTACVLPVRSSAKPFRKPEEQPAAPVEKPAAPAAAPVKKPASKTPDDHSNPWKYAYWVYSRPAGESRYLLTDVRRGAVGVRKINAPRFKEEHLEMLKEALDETAAMNPGASFQIRTIDKGTTVYTAVATFTPDMFAAKYAA